MIHGQTKIKFTEILFLFLWYCNWGVSTMEISARGTVL